MNNRNQRERGREQEAFKVRRLLWGVPAAPSGEGKPYPGVGIPGGGPGNAHRGILRPDLSSYCCLRIISFEAPGFRSQAVVIL